MRRFISLPGTAQVLRLRHLAGTALTALSLSGCANFWDEVTSRDFEVKALFVKPNPLSTSEGIVAVPLNI